jgi:hypothetical protein
MPEPISMAIIWALHHYGVVLVSVLAIVITVETLTEWFRARGRIKIADKDVIALTIAERVANKQYAVIPGVFDGKPANTRIVQAFYNERTKQVLDARAVASAVNPNQQIIRSHAQGDGMVVYT